MRAYCRQLVKGGKSIGLVPTMGALHEGHLSLVRRAEEENDLSLVSIFVNPIQFGPREDFHKYPRAPEHDLAKLALLHVDAVFMPPAGEMYPEGFSASIHMGKIGEILCGISRPGHFDGVATVVAKLFNILMPDRVYFGQKDFQQTVIIKKLVSDLNFQTDIVVCPIIREPDGLAMSSRNIYLNDKERKSALVLFKTLKFGEKLILSEGMKDALRVREEMTSFLKSEPLAAVEYIEIADPRDLSPVNKIEGSVVLLIAVKIGNTRLIDNIIIERN